VLVGRESECARLDELLDQARMGRSGAVVIRGEAGIGKTALLEYAAAAAHDMTVVRAVGVESEVQLEFSGLLEVCWPLRARLDELPDRQAGVLRSALRTGPAEELDRFSVGAATLGLLAAAAESNPVSVIVDDAQWLDPASQEALVFATKRLQADRAVILFGARDGEEQPFEAPGIESLALTGLPREAAADLMLEADAAAMAPAVADRLYEATGGNPLALLELPGLLSAQQLTGTAPLSDPLPAGASVERAFARRAEALPEESRRALVVAAVSRSNEADVIAAAMVALDIPAEALGPAEDAGLLRIDDGRLEFRHPLVRSAVFHGANASDRRGAHRALASALTATRHAEVRAWHLAGAALGPDDEASEALEQAAEHARRRGGYAAAAAALERAARLSPDAGTGARRLAGAADAAWRAGRTEAASRLVGEALAGAADDDLRATALRLQGSIEFFAGNGEAAAQAMLESLDLLDEGDPGVAVAAAADAVHALLRVRKPDLALDTAMRARALAPEDGSDADAEATSALGYALCFAGRFGEAEPHLRRALELSASTQESSPSFLRVVRLSAAFGWLGRHEEAHAYLRGLVARAREDGAAGALAPLLATSAWQALHAGRWNEAYADASEAFELAEALDQPVTATQVLGVLAWVSAFRGDEDRCRRHSEDCQRMAAERGHRLYGLLASLCVGMLEIAHGRIEAALAELEPVARHADERRIYVPGVSPQLELAEAHIRAGSAGEAEPILAAFERSELTSVALFGAQAERCRGLLAEADGFEPHFTKALDLHAECENPFALARTRLCYGEQLRRARRRIEAREQLRAAVDTFERIGAAPWAQRAGTELRATGETLRRRESHEAEELTPQELQIALQVAEGKTNKEVGAALFLSHKTIEFHLSRIYRKLDIHSRAELIRLYATESALTGSAARL
jgi:DNA-binding CsgD family transcriptional regulator/tetratricopeptide (TPR) repeat protein